MTENHTLTKPAGVDDTVWQQMLSATPQQARHLIRSGAYAAPTSGLCPGYAQANLIVLPKEQAFDFLLFAQRNPKPCPLLEVTEVGKREATICATDCDIATDFPKYRIYEYGQLVAEVDSVADYWRDDLVAFVIGCSFSFESELIEAGIEMRHNTMGCNVPMYLTGVACTPAGSMSGNMVMSMRPIPYNQVVKATQISGAIPKVHGAPMHIGDPAAIGVKDINKPEFGDAVEIHAGEVPVFWACGVTPQSVVMSSKPPFAITHAPGHMLITDTKNVDLKG
ncbi:putative hydro-lyase [Adlercreutzia sp. ZJ141]|uniref:putative hydro-lyase n=1 Tax=Adlercreutzia sp. ZJ141 TaxID=2709406 RepID=UPI0013EDD3BB|nr:putative hydro-lyase [Adlercreutzia sp. ZJ141]